MEMCKESGTVYTGGWPKQEHESAYQYLERLHLWASQGCLIPDVDMNKISESGFETEEDVLGYWDNL